jgi:hypothetical protein
MTVVCMAWDGALHASREVWMVLHNWLIGSLICREQKHGRSSLYVASEAGHWEVVQALLDAGVDAQRVAVRVCLGWFTEHVMHYRVIIALIVYGCVKPRISCLWMSHTLDPTTLTARALKPLSVCVLVFHLGQSEARSVAASCS